MEGPYEFRFAGDLIRSAIYSIKANQCIRSPEIRAVTIVNNFSLRQGRTAD